MQTDLGIEPINCPPSNQIVSPGNDRERDTLASELEGYNGANGSNITTLIQIEAQVRNLQREANEIFATLDQRLEEVENRYKAIGFQFMAAKKLLPRPLGKSFPDWLEDQNFGIRLSRANEYIRMAKGETTLKQARQKYSIKNAEVRDETRRLREAAKLLGANQWLGAEADDDEDAAIDLEQLRIDANKLFFQICNHLRHCSYHQLRQIADLVQGLTDEELAFTAESDFNGGVKQLTSQ